MNEKTEKTPENPISEIIDDTTYAKLTELQLLDETEIRNYVMKQEYAELRKTHKQGETLNIMAQKYVYLQPDTIKSIVNKKKKGAIV